MQAVWAFVAEGASASAAAAKPAAAASNTVPSRALLNCVRPEQVSLGPQMLDICARLPAPGQHRQQMHQQHAPVMNRGALAAPRTHTPNPLDS